MNGRDVGASARTPHTPQRPGVARLDLTVADVRALLGLVERSGAQRLPDAAWRALRELRAATCPARDGHQDVGAGAECGRCGGTPRDGAR